MKKRTGVWIDTKKAVIVFLEEDGHSSESIYSSIDNRERIPGEGKLFGRFGNQFINFEKKKQNKLENNVRTFCREVVSKLENSDEIVIIGPSHMKKILKDAIGQDEILSKIQTAIETTDTLTDNQIIAWVKNYYGL